MQTLTCRLLPALAASVVFLNTPVWASCGSAFCTLNTAWESQGVSMDPGWRLDLRNEYVDQDQLREGRNKTGAEGILDEHDEVRTLNRNTLLTLSYAPNADWSFSMQVPRVRRDHTHVHNDIGGPEVEKWTIEGMGDIKFTAYKRLSTSDITSGAIIGLKLPTGQTDIKNSDGEAAERPLQPGTGTTDVVAGFYVSAIEMLANTPVRYFAQTHAQMALNEVDDFRPGNQYSADIGMAYPASGPCSGLLQLNSSVRGSDRGDEAEPDHSGSSQIWLSPGISVNVGQSQWYGFVQLPLYQRVSGVQLTADWTVSAGIHWRF